MSTLDLDKIIDIYSGPQPEGRESDAMVDPTLSRDTTKKNEPSTIVPGDIDDLIFEIPDTVQFVEEEIPELNLGSEVTIEAEAVNLEAANAEIEDIKLEDQELLKEIAAIPDKMAFKIGEVADIVGVKQYVLRYWETEFEALRPKKSRQNQRMYTRKDIENTLLIKKLLYRDKFSIEGARRALRSLKAQVRESKQWDQVVDRYENAIQNLHSLIGDIKDLRSKIQQ